MLAFALGVVCGAAQKHRNAGAAQRVFDALEHGNAESAVPIGRNQSDSETAATQEALRQTVGAEAKSLRRRAHQRARLGTQLAGTVQALGYRSINDARRFGDVAYRWLRLNIRI